MTAVLPDPLADPAGFALAAADDIVALRARWVAEALEGAAAHSAVPLWDEATKHVVYAVTAETLSGLAAEYRDGQR